MRFRELGIYPSYIQTLAMSGETNQSYQKDCNHICRIHPRFSQDPQKCFEERHVHGKNMKDDNVYSQRQYLEGGNLHGNDIQSETNGVRNLQLVKEIVDYMIKLQQEKKMQKNSSDVVPILDGMKHWDRLRELFRKQFKSCSSHFFEVLTVE